MKLCTSQGIGGNPTRSKYARRIKVARSAGAPGVMPTLSSFEAMKLSTGVFTHWACATVGTTGGRIGCQAQCFLPALVSWATIAAFGSGALVAGYGAPILIQ